MRNEMKIQENGKWLRATSNYISTLVNETKDKECVSILLELREKKILMHFGNVRSITAIG